ncbi:MAG: hypothetical protein ACLTC1_12045 [Turicibacter sp.]
MDVRFVYSLILIISMMFLCLMIPPDAKQKSQEKENITRMDLKSQLISNLLYPKIIAKIREERAVTPLKVNSEEIDLLHIEPINETQISIKLAFSSFLNEEKVYAHYVATYLIDSLGDIETQTFQETKELDDIPIFDN